MHHITQRARLWALWKLTSAHISITFFFLAVVLSPRQTHTHTHTDTHEAAHHVATCQAVSWLHRCDSFSDLQSLKSLSLCRWWSSGNLLTSHYWHYELSGIVCVCLCVCVNMCMLSDPYVSGLTWCILTLIMFEGPVTAEVYLVLSDALCCAVVYVLSLMGGLCIIKLFFA